MNIYENLKKYFENTPKERIKADWESTEKYDSIGITAEELFKKLTIPSVINSICPRCDCETKGYVSNKVRYWDCENCGVSGQTDL